VEASPQAPPGNRRARFRYLRRTTIALLAGISLALLLVLGLLKFLQSPLLCRHAARRIEALSSELGGVDLEIGNLSWEVLPPRLLLKDLRLQTRTFTLHCRDLGIGLGAFRMSRRTIVLSSVEAAGVDLSLNGRPRERRKISLPLRLLIENLSVRDFSFEGKTTGAELQLQRGEISWVRQQKATSGYCRLDTLRFRGGGLDEIQASLTGSFVEEAGRLRIRSLSLDGPGLALRASGEFSRLGGAGHLSGEVEIKELDRIIRTHGLLSGKTLKLSAEFNTAARDFIALDLQCPEIVVSHDFPLKAFHGRAKLSSDGLRGRVLEAEFFGGRFRGSYSLDGFHGAYLHRVEASCAGMDLRSFLQTIHVPDGGLSAGMNVSSTVTWRGRKFPRGSGRADIEFSPRPGALPLQGSLSLKLDGGAFLEFDAEKLLLGHSRITLQGPLHIGGWEPAWSIHADPARLDEILPAVNRWVGSTIFPRDIAGAGVMDISMDGPWKDLSVGVHLDVRDLSWPPLHIDRADLDGVAARGAFRLAGGHFRIGDGAGQLRGEIRWRPPPGKDPLELQIDARDIPLEDIMGWAGFDPGLWSGELSFSGGLRGAVGAPSGSWALGIHRMRAGGLDCGDGSASIELEDGVFRARHLSFDSGLQGSLSWHVMARKLDGKVEWKGLPIDTDSVAGRLFGPDPIDWEADFRWALSEALPRGELLLGNGISSLRGSLSDEGLKCSLRLRDALTAEVEVPGFRADESWRGGGRIDISDLGVLVDRVGNIGNSGLGGKLRLDLKVEGRGTGLEALEIRPVDMQIAFNERPLSLDGGGVLRWTPEGFSLEESRVSTEKGTILLGGSLDAEGMLDGRLSGTLDAGLLGFLLPEWEPAGTLSGSIRILGSAHAPYFEGEARLEKASFRLPSTSLILSDVSGPLSFSRGKVAFEDISFRMLRGRGHGEGSIQIAESPPFFALSGRIQGMEYPLFEGLTPRISGSWHLGGPLGDFTLGGDLNIDSAELRSKKDLPTLLLDWLDTADEPKEPVGLNLNLHVRSERTLLARSPMIRLVGSADLHILGNAATPGMVGQMTFEEGGEITVQGVRYEIDHAHLGFADPNSMEAMVNVGLDARIQDYEVRVQLNGSAEHLVPMVSSDPPLSPSEIFSLMSVGSLDSGTGAGGAIGLSVASSMLSTGLQNALESRDLWLLPIDQVRIDPFIENATGDPSARVTVVKQLSPNFTVTLQSDLSAQKNQVVTGRWYLGSGLFVEASRDQDRQIGIDLKLRKRY